MFLTILMCFTQFSLAVIANGVSECGSLHLKDGSTVILLEETPLSPGEFSKVHINKLKGAMVNADESRNCVVVLCGFTSLRPRDSETCYGSSKDYGGCEHFSVPKTNLSLNWKDTIFNEIYNLSSVTCACQKQNPYPRGCDYSCQHQNDTRVWTGNQCAVLYQEMYCNDCQFRSFVLETESQFVTNESAVHINSLIVKPGCVVRHHMPSVKKYCNWKDLPVMQNYTNFNAVFSIYSSDPEYFTCECGIYPPHDDSDSQDVFLIVFTLIILPLILVFIIIAIIVKCVRQRKVSEEGRNPLIPNTETDIPNEQEAEEVVNADNGNTEDLREILNISKQDLTKFMQFLRTMKTYQNKKLGIEVTEPSSSSDFSLGKEVRIRAKFENICTPNFRLSMDSLKISRKKLGSGRFSNVFNGTLSRENGATGELVAVKKLKALNTEDDYINSFLNEIRYFIVVGSSHENLIAFIGACCYKGEICIVTQLCEKGDLGTFLKEHMRPKILQRQRIKEVLGTMGDYTMPQPGQEESQRTLVPQLRREEVDQFLLWSEQIAEGMRFLQSKNVIHGDLAIRNVLLTRDLTAKICDYGLSVQCLEDKYYARSAQMLMPRVYSMAPEIFKNNLEESSTKIPKYIDIWAYGCTIREIFALGDPPNVEIEMHRRENLVAVIQERLMIPPPLAPPYIFKKIKECWNTVPRERPSFEELIDFFQKARSQKDKLLNLGKETS